MKKSTRILAVLILVMVFALLFLFRWKDKKASPTSIPVPTAVTQLTATNPPSTTYTHKPGKRGILKQYQQGTTNKGQAMQQLALAKNHNLDLYGKVIDQYGRPVAGAKIQGDVVVNLGFMQQRDDVHFAETDESGNFSFLGFNGSGLGIWPQKTGYFYNLKLQSRRPDNYRPNPNNPVVFTMWKLRGPESLTSYTIDSKIPFDGTPVTFDIASQKIDSNGDFRVSLMRSPQMVRRSGESFNWNLKIEMLNGGGVDVENDPYPYWAPKDGYNSSFTIDMSSNNIPWSSQLTQEFYIRNAAGQYGLLHASVYTALTPARVQFNFTFNPSGSQNLEPASQ